MVAVLAASDARAFDYAEHEFISRMALEGLQQSPPNGLTKAQVVGQLATLKLALNKSYCDIKGAVPSPAEAPSCFLPSDIPAMFGDHAGSPALLKWRFFDDNIHPKHPSLWSIAWDWTKMTFGKGFAGCLPPENSLSVPPADGEAFVAVVRQHALPDKWKAGKPEDGSLSSVDGNYYTLAANGCSHFRDVSELSRIKNGETVRAVRQSLTENRYDYTLKNDARQTPRTKPDLASFAWYGDLHTGALAFARASHGAAPDAGPKLAAMALLLELSSLHPLEDSVAPGHTVTDAKHLSNVMKLGSHNANNDNGLTERLTSDGCRLIAGMVPAFGSVSAQCSPPTSFTAFGDHVMFSKERRERGLLTLEIASMAARESISAVMQEIAGTDAPSAYEAELAQCVTKTDAPKDAAWTWPNDSQNGWVYRCAFAWWEIPETQRVARVAAIRDAWARGQMNALLVLPLPDSVHETGEDAPGRVGSTVPDTNLPRASSGCGRCSTSRENVSALGALASSGLVVLAMIGRRNRKHLRLRL